MERILRRNTHSLHSVFPPLPESEADCALNTRVKHLEIQLQQFQAELELKEEECKTTIINAEKTLLHLKVWIVVIIFGIVSIVWLWYLKNKINFS